LFGDQAAEELDVGPVVAAGIFGEGGEHFGGAVELEVAEVVFDLFVDAHVCPPS
jgi:hypothetical protein